MTYCTSDLDKILSESSKMKVNENGELVERDPIEAIDIEINDIERQLYNLSTIRADIPFSEIEQFVTDGFFIIDLLRAARLLLNTNNN